MSDHFAYKIEKSAIVTLVGIIFLFSFSVIITLVAPRHVDDTWMQPSSDYQVQMYEVMDPNLYISSLGSQNSELQAVYHLKNNDSLLTFQEAENVRIVSPPELDKFITHMDDKKLKLTSHLMLLREPQGKMKELAEKKQKELKDKWSGTSTPPAFDFFELYEPEESQAFAVAPTDRIVENWVDSDFVILDDTVNQPWHAAKGVVFVKNPQEYRVLFYQFADQKEWRFDPVNGTPIKNLEELTEHKLGFRSRKELIAYGEHIYAIEGCWYCHTDQTRTLIQDVVLNGSDSYPAPPSSANEYIYQKITFPGTRRIGPDLSRVGVKRPSRDWHKAHFWAPKTQSKGSIMPSFRHFFDYDPRGTALPTTTVPNYEFEALFQYLMTKGTRITPPTEAWWLGKDPIQTKAIIEGKKQ